MAQIQREVCKYMIDNSTNYHVKFKSIIDKKNLINGINCK